MKLYIDADACPVTKLAVSIAIKYGIKCIIICDTSHVISEDGAKTIVVSKGNDSADFALVNLIKTGDIAVTQDYGLACMCLGKGAYVINQNGLEYTNDNIIYFMETRHEAKRLRMRGKHMRGPKPRSKIQDFDFEKRLTALIERIRGTI